METPSYQDWWLIAPSPRVEDEMLVSPVSPVLQPVVILEGRDS